MTVSSNLYGYIFTDATETTQIIVSQDELALPLPTVGQPLDVSDGSKTLSGTVKTIKIHVGITRAPTVTVRQIDYTVVLD